ncbi:hypothetical protein [Burkholderia sp. RF2-non_BP3]|uniref:hypothetical protein n=1 Tax=Burkholderia sp. RF2-non_BP3 TaxID=1637844 RepID=UPI000A674742|nr:hypothetical protein [Burkholderia sp. RF2-non_BP3]
MLIAAFPVGKSRVAPIGNVESRERRAPIPQPIDGVQYFPDRAGMHERIAGQRTRECVLNSSMRSVRHIEKLNKKPSN